MIPVDQGVSGIRDLKTITLLSKWLWRLLHEKDSLRTKVNFKKYCLLESSTLDLILLFIVAPILCGIRKMGPFFFNNIKATVGNGADIPFWIVPWMSGLSFKEIYTRLFPLSSHPNTPTFENIRREDNRWSNVIYASWGIFNGIF